MAEAFLNFFFPEGYEAHSAGIMASELQPEVAQVMSEIGVSMSAQRPKNVEEFVGTRFDTVALVCGDPPAECPFLRRPRHSLNCKECQSCCTFFPFFPKGSHTVHIRFQEIPRLSPSGEQSFDAYRRLRDEVREWVLETFG